VLKTDFTDIASYGGNCVIAGNKGIVLVSTNNGKNWHVQKLDNYSFTASAF
jgi:photosystem II stability/assembly factor-like uncharacterized protein